MEWLNYHHLLYFWTVARTGSIAKAGKELRLAPSTISGQLSTLEECLGEKLLVRKGRTLQLTDTGNLVYRYADEIFSLGRELMGTLRKRPSGRPLRLIVGISDVVPKLIAHRLLEPALSMDVPVQIVCREGKTERLLADLALSDLDLVIADAPIAGHAPVRAYNHLLGECEVSFLAVPRLAQAYRRGFPASLEGAPMLVPTDNTLLRRALDRWLELEGVRPRIVAEFEDSALLKVFGQHGVGVFAVPSVLEVEVRHQYGVQVVGRTDMVKERFYAITIERRIKHPAVVAISSAARTRMFGL